MKRAGISPTDLATVYLSVVRPVLQYACPVLWHSCLPMYLSDNIELIQKRALRSIYPGERYADILHRTGIQSLRERVTCCANDIFAKCSNLVIDWIIYCQSQGPWIMTCDSVPRIHCRSPGQPDAEITSYHGGYIINNECAHVNYYSDTYIIIIYIICINIDVYN